jgi:alkylhydroperoxidase family enzyme
LTERIRCVYLWTRPGAAIERVVAGPGADGWTDRQRTLLRAVDVLLAERTLDDATWVALSAHLDAARLVELCLLVGHYDMLATTIAALRIERDVFTPGREAAA